MTKLAQSALLAAILSLALASAAAQTLTGTVTNGTTNKPAAGDEVILINLANGMDVAGSTKADSNGKFSFKITVARAAPHPRHPSGSYLSSDGASRRQHGRRSGL